MTLKETLRKALFPTEEELEASCSKKIRKLNIQNKVERAELEREQLRQEKEEARQKRMESGPQLFSFGGASKKDKKDPPSLF